MIRYVDKIFQGHNGTSWVDIGRKYAIGDTAHGGLVFRLDETGQHGLVCSFTDLKSSLNDDTPHWSTDIANYTGATGGSSIFGSYAGVMNTTLIISADPSDIDSAARLCGDFQQASCGDWYLPSRSELAAIHSNLFLNGVGTFALGGFYWSSTEDKTDPSKAWGISFFSGSPSSRLKDGGGRVRAIRAF